MEDKRVVAFFIAVLIVFGYWGNSRRENAHAVAVQFATDKQMQIVSQSFEKAAATQKAYLENLAHKNAEMQWKIRNETLLNIKIEAEKKLRREKMYIEETNAQIYGEPTAKTTADTTSKETVKPTDAQQDAEIPTAQPSAIAGAAETSQKPVVTAGLAPASVGGVTPVAERPAEALRFTATQDAAEQPSSTQK